MGHWCNFNVMSVELRTAFSSHKADVSWVEILLNVLINFGKVCKNNVTASV